jgi:hypothetical protein
MNGMLSYSEGRPTLTNNVLILPKIDIESKAYYHNDKIKDHLFWVDNLRNYSLQGEDTNVYCFERKCILSFLLQTDKFLRSSGKPPTHLLTFLPP